MTNNQSPDLVPILSDGIKFNKLNDNDYILCNSSDRHYLKINEDVYNVLCLIDGKRSIGDISVIFESTYEMSLSVEAITSLLFNDLLKYGILKGYEEKVKPYEKPSYLKLSFTIFNEKVVAKITRYFLFLFKPAVAFTFIVCTISFAIYILINKMDVYYSYNIQASLVLFFLAMFCSVTFHEIGHATAAKFFGATHGGIGGGFYLFKPVYYADVTDIWKLNKKQRVIVSLAGVYFELIFCFIISFLGLISNANILIFISLIVSLNSLFNLIPFLRSDGYWIVSDLTNKPNLFSYSKSKVRDAFMWLIKRKKIHWSIIDSFLFVYGIAMYYFITLFIYKVVIVNPDSVIYFPLNAFNFIKGLIQGEAMTLAGFGKLLMPIFFYYLSFNFAKSLWGSYKKRKHITPQK
ncbi:hypothetical protein BN938_0647 [Mucinivorans hirudinis]|uniref:Peptide zinc metalloprotease protein n=1 Tax=Mucinivorans hirudinis TaxID=1433126 RepID=A0A060R6T2_9BACT|nr:hypothetical protein BN938_0647 [Mucinivorans hirudinis]